MGKYGGEIHARQWDKNEEILCILHMAMGCSREASCAHYGAEKLGCTVIPVSGGMTERQVTLINDFTPTTIMVTPSYMLNILEQFNKQGIDPSTTSLQVGIFGAEPWTDPMRDEIQKEFNMHAVDIYGLSEVLGPG